METGRDTAGTALRPTPRQEEILDHAMALVRRGGLAAVTTKRLAESVGFTEAALYRHFPSKRALILGMIDRLEAMLLGPIREIAGDETLAVGERLERIVRHHTAIVREHRSLPILLLAEASVSEDEALLARMTAMFSAYLGIVEELVRKGQDRGELVADPEPDCLALLLIGAPAALAIRHRLLPDGEAEQRFSDSLIPFLLRSIRSERTVGRSR